MNPLFPIVLIASAVLGVNVMTAQAGPCTQAIASFESAVRQSSKNPDAGATARQSIGAQLHRQPTPGSVKQAEETAHTGFAEALARAKALDEADRAECAQVLESAKNLFELR